MARYTQRPVGTQGRVRRHLPSRALQPGGPLLHNAGTVPLVPRSYGAAPRQDHGGFVGPDLVQDF